MNVSQWKNLGLTYTDNILNLQRKKKKMGKTGRKGKGKEENMTRREAYQPLNSFVGKIADKINLKNKGFI